MLFVKRDPYIFGLNVFIGILATAIIVAISPTIRSLDPFTWITFGSLGTLVILFTALLYEQGAFLVINFQETLNPLDSRGRQLLPILMAIVFGLVIWLMTKTTVNLQPFSHYLAIAVITYLTIEYLTVTRLIDAIEARRQTKKMLMHRRPGRL